ncbi:hypothetical protein D3C78_1344210 [compost metagenome]
MRIFFMKKKRCSGMSISEKTTNTSSSESVASNARPKAPRRASCRLPRCRAISWGRASPSCHQATRPSTAIFTRDFSSSVRFCRENIRPKPAMGSSLDSLG